VEASGGPKGPPFSLGSDIRIVRRYRTDDQIEITRHGRRELVLMSADHYDWLLAAARRTHRTADAATVVVEAVRRAEMGPGQVKLDELLK
jgi:prevent-host-death family protein